MAALIASALFCFPSASRAQKTVVQDAGGGHKQELVYDASGKIVETRTLDSDGTLMVRNTFEYKPGFYAPQQRSISYWPGGKLPAQSTEATFDENANFTGEIIEIYDRNGRHTGGHKLTHDPWTGIYRCSNWQDAAQEYVSVECPSGEESGGKPQPPQHIGYAEASARLARARQASAAERKSHRVALARPTQAPLTSRDLTVGMVLPAQLVPGERASGSVVQDLTTYEDIPSLNLVRMTIPVEPAADSAPLSAWDVEVSGSQPQPADSPFSFQVPRNAAQLTLTLRRRSDPTKSVSQTVALGTATAPASSDKFEAPWLVIKDSVSEVRGQFSGDATQTFAALDSQPAPIVAESRRAAYIKVPEETKPWSHSLILADGRTLVAIPVVAGEITFQPGPRNLEAGQTWLLIARFSGPDHLPDEDWTPGVFPRGSVEQARELVPGFIPPAHDEEHAGAREGDESKARSNEESEERNDKRSESAEHADEPGGKILLVLKNTAPENVSFRASSNQTYAFTLTPDSFSQGEFVYKFVAEARRSGSFSVKASVIPFLAPSTARPLTPP